ncbi:MAG: hypothetical protein ACPGVU_05970, partial [Limisphaerales bacterium]
HLVKQPNENTPPMFARVVRNGNALVLTPQFALTAGNSYHAILQRPNDSALRKVHRIPLPDRTVPKVLAVYPRAKVVPANLLKFYLYFSEPMREGREIFDLIHLKDASGKSVHSPWRRQELWSDDARRLALWIHPGRIKRGVNLRETLGPVLSPNAEYTLVIDSRMRSATGVPLGRSHHTKFRTGPEDRECPAPQDWMIQTPAAKAKKPIRISASESFDHALLARHQWIEDSEGKRIAGQIKIGKGEHLWFFQPARPWKANVYRLCVDEWLEDLAGNTPHRKFERHINDPEPLSTVTKIQFVIHERNGANNPVPLDR